MLLDGWALFVSAVIVATEGMILLYFLTLNSLYFLFAVVAFFELRRHRRRWTARDLDVIVRSPATPKISLILPAHNEQATITQSLRSLLLLNYPAYEVVVVNDGSVDGTLQAVVSAFDLARADVPHELMLETQPIRGVYRSLTHRELIVVDKVNGGKADAINAGINAAAHPLVCVIDADSLLEEHALTRAVLPFLEDPTTVAAGGIIRIANGCRVVDGRVISVGLPSSSLACFQVTEYLRAFLVGRVAHSMMNSLLIISGAFGLFRRDALIAVGGFKTDTVGEDMEVVVRMHRLFRERGQPYRIVFRPDPVCWTEVPERIDTLASQRNRWQRGTLQTLSRHRNMMLNPRYGVIGMLAMPYFLIFEALAPIIEVLGYLVMAVALVTGSLDWKFAQLFFLAAVVYGALISVTAVILEEVSFRKYPRLLDLLRLSLYGVLENFGYRQLTMWWRLRGSFDYLRGSDRWGPMVRRGFTEAQMPPPAVVPQPVRARSWRRILPVLVILAWSPAPVALARTQADQVVASARESAVAGNRPEALASLERHLADAPRDVDARLLYGLILSWEGRYEEARRELDRVLIQAPGYDDARVALMNVAWWSGDRRSARDAADTILARTPGNQSARTVRDWLDAASRPWSVGINYANDSFSDNRSVWQEVAASITRMTPRGSVIVRATEARRFGFDDRLVEVDLYPRIRPGTYAFVGVGGAPDSTFYPSYRVAFDLYQSVGAGFEISGGYRRLGFDDPADIYVATVSKYLGRWMLTSKVFHVPGDGRQDATSYHAGFRRYVRDDGISYIGLTYSRGFSREEIRNSADLTTLGSDTVRAEIDQQLARRYAVFATAGTSRQARQLRSQLWQHSVSAGLRIWF
jgi:YaiO family outer membrane protein